MVEAEFTVLMDMISLPFLVVTIPLAGFLGYMILRTFNGSQDAVKELADDVKGLTITLAKMSGVK